MDHAALVEKYRLIKEQLERFSSRIKRVEAGEQIYAKKPNNEDLVEITPNVLARYRNMISVCEFTIQLIEDHHLSEADVQEIAAAPKKPEINRHLCKLMSLT